MHYEVLGVSGRTRVLVTFITLCHCYISFAPLQPLERRKLHTMTLSTLEEMSEWKLNMHLIPDKNNNLLYMFMFQLEIACSFRTRSDDDSQLAWASLCYSSKNKIISLYSPQNESQLSCQYKPRGCNA